MRGGKKENRIMETNGLPASSQTTEENAAQGAKSGADLQQANGGTAMAYGYKKTEQENLLRIGGEPDGLINKDFYSLSYFQYQTKFYRLL